MTNTMPPPWFIEARLTPFHPWRRLNSYARLETACSVAARLKAEYRYSAVRVRAD